jgi:hypothetical protein
MLHDDWEEDMSKIMSGGGKSHVHVNDGVLTMNRCKH